jgi:hypothetical protein
MKEKRDTYVADMRKRAARKDAWWTKHLLESEEDERLAKLAFELLRAAYRSGGAVVWHEDFVQAGIHDVGSALADLQIAGYEIWPDFGHKRRGEKLQEFYRLESDELEPAEDEDDEDDEVDG